MILSSHLTFLAYMVNDPPTVAPATSAPDVPDALTRLTMELRKRPGFLEATALSQKAMAIFSEGKHDEALQMLVDAEKEAAAKNNQFIVALCQLNQALLTLNLPSGRPNAEQEFTRSHTLLDSARSIFAASGETHDDYMIAEVEDAQAQQFFKTGHWNEAVGKWRSALDGYEKTQAPELTVRPYINLADLFSRYEPRSTFEPATKALDILKIPTLHLVVAGPKYEERIEHERHELRKAILSATAYAHYKLGETETAIKDAKQAIVEAELTKDDLSIAQEQHTLGVIYADAGDEVNGRLYYNKALKIFTGLNNHEGKGVVFNSFGILAYHSGDRQEARYWYERSIDEDRTAVPLNEANLANDFRNLGMVYRSLGDAKRAKLLYRRVREAADRLKSGLLLAGVNLSEGELLEDDSQFDAARASYTAALEFYRKNGLLKQEEATLDHLTDLALTEGRRSGNKTLLRVAEAGYRSTIKRAEAAKQPLADFVLPRLAIAIFLGRGDAAQAEALLQTALKNAQQSPNPLAATDVYEGLTVLGAARKQYAQVDRALESQQKLYDGNRSRLMGTETQLQYQTAYADLCRTRVVLNAVDMKNPVRGYKILQEGKAGVLLNATQNRRGRIPGVPAAQQQVWQDRDDEIVRLNRILEEASDTLNENQRKQQKEREQLIEQRRREEASLPNGRQKMSPSGYVASVAEISHVLPNDTALLEFCVTEPGDLQGAAVIFVHTKDKAGNRITFHRLATPPRLLEAQAQKLNQYVSGRKEDWAAVARQIYDAIILPILPRITGKKRLIICPDGQLWKVPFAALLDKQRVPLIQHFDLVHSYSASYMAWQQAQPQRGRGKSNGALLILPDPGPNEKPLKQAKPEAEKITAERHGRVQVATGLNATKENIKRELGKYSYAHLIGHGYYDEKLPMESYVQVSGNGSKLPTDSRLAARDLYRLDLRLVDLLVLSTCEGGAGTPTSGEGLVGMAWAIAAAGCRAQALSLWKIDDNAAKDTMVEFNHQLMQRQQEEGGPCAALCAAIRTTRTKYPHPQQWAPVVFFGDWR